MSIPSDDRSAGPEAASSEELSADSELDATGLMCPEPVMLLHTRITDVAPGGLLRVLATDPSTTRDVPRFCQFLGHELVHESHEGDRYVYLIRRCAD